MTEGRLKQLLERFKDLRITVLGDLFLDRWWEVDEEKAEPSVETGKTAWQVTGRRMSAGAAGTVLNNLSALQVKTIRVISAIGDDGEGYELVRLLREKGIDLSFLIRDERIKTPTYTKPMFFSHESSETEGERFDIKNFSIMPEEIQKNVIYFLEQAAEESDAIIVLDQLLEEDTGVVTSMVRDALAHLGKTHPDLLIFVDSRGYADRFSQVTVKCNDKEAMMWSGIQSEKESSIEQLGQCMEKQKKRTGRPAVITCGARGILVETKGRKVLVPALPVTGEIDVCGCGDVTTSGMVSALCAGADWEEAAQMGNLCAAVTIRKIGQTGTSSPEEVLERYRRGCKGEM